MDRSAGLRKALEDAASGRLERFAPLVTGELAIPRLEELVAAVNRMRGLALTAADSQVSEQQ